MSYPVLLLLWIFENVKFFLPHPLVWSKLKGLKVEQQALVVRIMLNLQYKKTCKDASVCYRAEFDQFRLIKWSVRNKQTFQNMKFRFDWGMIPIHDWQRHLRLQKDIYLTWFDSQQLFRILPLLAPFLFPTSKSPFQFPTKEDAKIPRALLKI